jgi:cation diffusion facilitator family transporter
MYLIIVCVITIIVKLSLFIYTRKLGKQHENLLITAASEDHRNDVFLTSATLIGIVCSEFGVYYIDGVVGIIISIWIAYVALKLFISSYDVLIDTGINDSSKERIINVINECNNCSIDSLISAPIGINYILLIEISVDEHISLEDAHNIAEKIKKQVCKIEKIVDAIIHVNPKSE